GAFSASTWRPAARASARAGPRSSSTGADPAPGPVVCLTAALPPAYAVPMRRTAPFLLLLGVLAPWLAWGQPPGIRLGGGTPPRLAVVEGTASFWRPGASDWTSARPNTPLGTGDAIFSQRDTSVEVQIGPSAYLRLGAGTYLELSEVAADQLQLKLSGGEVSLDV